MIIPEKVYWFLAFFIVTVLYNKRSQLTPFVLDTFLLQRLPNHTSCFLHVIYTIVLFTTTQPATTGSAAILVLLGPALLGNCHTLSILAGLSSSPKSESTWLTLSSCTVALPRSSSRTKRTPTPLLSANSTWVRLCSFLFARIYSPISINLSLISSLTGINATGFPLFSTLSGTNVVIILYNVPERDYF